jgi:hypothetical protein
MDKFRRKYASYQMGEDDDAYNLIGIHVLAITRAAPFQQGEEP